MERSEQELVRIEKLDKILEYTTLPNIIATSNEVIDRIRFLTELREFVAGDISGKVKERFSKEISYMEKKWKSLLRKEKKKEPTWQEVHGLICRFLEPIWEKLMEDQIFFGDWMPQLGRFLD